MPKNPSSSNGEQEYIASLLRSKLNRYAPSWLQKRRVRARVYRKSQSDISIFQLLHRWQLQVPVGVLLLAVTAGTVGYYAYDIPRYPEPQPQGEDRASSSSSQSVYSAVQSSASQLLSSQKSSVSQAVRSSEIASSQKSSVSQKVRSSEIASSQKSSVRSQATSDSGIYMKGSTSSVQATGNIILSNILLSEKYSVGEEGVISIILQNTSGVSVDSVTILADINGNKQSKTWNSVASSETRRWDLLHTFPEAGTYTLTIDISASDGVKTPQEPEIRTITIQGE